MQLELIRGFGRKTATEHIMAQFILISFSTKSRLFYQKRKIDPLKN